MSASERPAPLVTISDPRHPGSVGEVVAQVLLPRPALRRRERLLVTLLVLLLVAAFTSSGRLRAEQRREQRLAGLELAAFVTGGEPAGGDALRLRVHLLLRADDETDVHLTSVRVDEGWWLQEGTEGLRLAHGTAAVLTVWHHLECGRPPVAPRRVSFTAAVDGAGSRDLAVEVVAGLRGVAFDATPYCGELDAVGALALSTSSVVHQTAGTVLTLRFVNNGLDSLHLGPVTSAGFVFVQRPPAVRSLPGRPPGVLATVPVPEHVAVYDVRVVDCALARQSLDVAAHEELPDLLDVEVDGRGGPDITHVDVPGLLTFLEVDWARRCAGGARR